MTLPCPSTRVTGLMTIFRAAATLMCTPSVILDQLVAEFRLLAFQQGGERSPENLGRRRTAGEHVVDPHHLVTGEDPVQEQRELGISGDRPTDNGGPFQVGFLQAVLQRYEVAHGGNAAGERALPDCHEHAAVLPEGAQHLDVLVVGDAPFDEPDVDGPREALDVIDGRLVEIDHANEIEDALVDVQEGHVAPEAARQVAGRDPRFSRHATPPSSRSRLSPSWPFPPWPSPRWCQWAPCHRRGRRTAFCNPRA